MVPWPWGKSCTFSVFVFRLFLSPLTARAFHDAPASQDGLKTQLFQPWLFQTSVERSFSKAGFKSNILTYSISGRSLTFDWQILKGICFDRIVAISFNVYSTFPPVVSLSDLCEGRCEMLSDLNEQWQAEQKNAAVRIRTHINIHTAWRFPPCLRCHVMLPSRWQATT